MIRFYVLNDAAIDTLTLCHVEVGGSNQCNDSLMQQSPCPAITNRHYDNPIEQIEPR